MLFRSYHQRLVGFFRDRPPAAHTGGANAEFWFQRWIAIAQSVGIPRTELMESYYFDEFLAVMDEYNDLHTPGGKDEEVFADEWEG